MDFDSSFEVEGHNCSFRTESTPVKKGTECGICGSVFVSETALVQHLEVHTNDHQDEPLNLSLTSAGISPVRHHDTVEKTIDDMNTSCSVEVTTQNTFSCDICGYSSQFKQNLNRHLKRHTDTSRRQPRLKSEVKAKKPLETLKCDVCSYSTVYRFNLKRHVTLTHSNRQSGEQVEYICECCGKTLHSKYALSLHVKTVHEKVFKYKCSICNKGYNQLNPYRGHLASHHAVLKEKCDKCPATFNHQTSLAVHKLSAHSDVTFKCSDPSCSAVYSSSRPLRDHMKAVHSQERFRCDVCFNSYKWRSSLKYHRDTAHTPK